MLNQLGIPDALVLSTLIYCVTWFLITTRRP